MFVQKAKMNPTWKHPFTCVIAGPTGCGKTMWVRQFLQSVSTMLSPAPQEIVWCYGERQTVYEEMKHVTFVEGIPHVDLWSDGKPRLIILDDLMSEADGRITKLFTKGSHSCLSFSYAENIQKENY